MLRHVKIPKKIQTVVWSSTWPPNSGIPSNDVSRTVVCVASMKTFRGGTHPATLWGTHVCSPRLPPQPTARTPPTCYMRTIGVPGRTHTSSSLYGNPSLTDTSSGELWQGPSAAERETPALRYRLTGLRGRGTSSCFRSAGEEGAAGGCGWGWVILLSVPW